MSGKITNGDADIDGDNEPLDGNEDGTSMAITSSINKRNVLQPLLNNTTSPLKSQFQQFKNDESTSQSLKVLIWLQLIKSLLNFLLDFLYKNNILSCFVLY